MVDIVNTVSLQGNTPRPSSQGAVSIDTSDETLPSASASGFVSSHIRVDNLQNVAILEYRSSRTGEVIQQYPSQAQINAFRRAAHIHVEQHHESGVHISAPAPVHEEHSSAPSGGGDAGGEGKPTSVLA
jgi:hypothetical protein